MSNKQTRVIAASLLTDLARVVMEHGTPVKGDTAACLVSALRPLVYGMPPEELGNLLGEIVRTQAASYSKTQIRLTILWMLHNLFGPRSIDVITDILLFMVATARDKESSVAERISTRIVNALEDIERGNISKYSV